MTILAKRAEDAEIAREELKRKLAEEQRKTSEERMKQLTDSLANAETYKQEKKLLYTKAANLIVAMLCNYHCGNIDDPELDPNWEKNVGSVVDSCLTLDVFKLLCAEKTLLPLLWMTGKEADAFHTCYKIGSDGKVAITDNIKQYYFNNVDNYVKKVVKNYISNIMQSNCIDFTANMTEYINVCKEFVTKAPEECKDDKQFIARLHTLLNSSQFRMQTLMLTSRAGKILTSNRIGVLPPHYPKRIPEFEVAMSILMLCNTCIGHYGLLCDETGKQIANDNKNKTLTDSLKKNSNYGGMCFDIPSIFETVIERFFKYDGASGDDVTMWYWNDMTLVGNVEEFIEDNSVLGYDIYPHFGKHYDKTELYGTDASGKYGYYRFVNPTQKYTKLFINDADGVEVALHVPRLSAKVIDGSNYYKAVVENLMTNQKYKMYNASGVPNGWMYSCFDLLWVIPNDNFDFGDGVSPFSRFIFDTLVKNLCRWDLVIGLEDNMNFSKINTSMFETDGHEKFYPQTAYAHNAKYTGLYDDKWNYLEKHGKVSGTPKTFTDKLIVQTVVPIKCDIDWNNKVLKPV